MNDLIIVTNYDKSYFITICVSIQNTWSKYKSPLTFWIYGNGAVNEPAISIH